MNTNFTSLLPFLAALQRQPGTLQDEDDGNPSADQSGRGFTAAQAQPGGSGDPSNPAASQSNPMGDVAPGMAQGQTLASLDTKGQQLMALLQAGLRPSPPTPGGPGTLRPSPPTPGGPGTLQGGNGNQAGTNLNRPMQQQSPPGPGQPGANQANNQEGGQAQPPAKAAPAAAGAKKTAPAGPASLEEQLKRDEGHRNTADGKLDFYQDSEGKWTGGYGHNFDARGETPVVMTQQQADDQLGRDIGVARDDLARELPWTKDLDQVRREALENMTFNMGINNVLGFTKALANIQKGDYAGGADEMLNSKWAKQVGARANRLAEQMRTGVRQ